MADSNAPSPRGNVPAPRLDRGALERVLARAAQLQAGMGDTAEEFTEDQLLDVGKEVGLSAQHLRQALAEERTRAILPDDERGVAAALFGPSHVQAARTVPGTASDVLAAIDVWMQRTELLIVKRHHADRIVWEPRRDILVGIKRALRVGGRDYALSQAFEASATVVQVDDTRVHVGLDADFRTKRRQSVEQTVGFGVIGAGLSGSLFVVGAMAAVAIAPVVVLPIAGAAAARAFQSRIVTRAQLALEQLLDRLERGEINRRSADSLLGALVAAATAGAPRRR